MTIKQVSLLSLLFFTVSAKLDAMQSSRLSQAKQKTLLLPAEAQALTAWRKAYHKQQDQWLKNIKQREYFVYEKNRSLYELHQNEHTYNLVATAICNLASTKKHQDFIAAREEAQKLEAMIAHIPHIQKYMLIELSHAIHLIQPEKTIAFISPNPIPKDYTKVSRSAEPKTTINFS